MLDLRGSWLGFSVSFCSLEKFCFKLEFLFDWMRIYLGFTVVFISLMVWGYRFSYLSHDFRLIRFLIVLLTFISRIICLALASSWVSLFLGWEGLGFRRFFLVAYYNSWVASRGRFITAYINRVGDYSLLVCLALARGAGNRSILCNSSDSRSFLLGLSLLMLISLSCKRAQFPFIAWLPAAIAAPTPVSALVHSSTLVAAGVYLGIRRFRVMTPLVLLMLGALSSWRSVLSSLRALFCIDGKKVIALSTLSQISIVGIVLSLGLPSLALFHLLTHAFVKSYLFVSLGLVLHSSNGAQDFRSLGVGRSPVRTLHLV